ncbi:MAG: MFS transporter [Candidatus Asgardarchaeia archaeon]
MEDKELNGADSKDYSKSIRTVYVFVLFNNMASAMFSIFTSIVVYEISKDLFMTSLIMSIPQVFWIFGELFFGNIGDKRQNRKAIVIYATILSGLSLFPFLISESSPILIAAYSAASFFEGGMIPNLNAYVSLASSKKGESFGNLMAASSLGWFLGSIVSGVVMENFSYKTLYLLAIISLILSPFLMRGAEDFKVKPSKVRVDGFEGYVEILKDARVSLLLLSILILTVGRSAPFSIFSVFFIEGIGGDKLLFSIGNGLASILGAVSSYSLGKLSNRYDKAKFVLIFGFLGYVFTLPFFIFSRDPFLLLIVFIIPFYSFISTSVPVFISELVSEEKRTRGMALYATSMDIGLEVGFLWVSAITYLNKESDVVGLMKKTASFGFILSLISTVSIMITLNKVKGKKSVSLEGSSDGD